MIRAESTESASASNTTEILYKVASLVVPHIDPALLERVDGVLRKTGHFLGYAILAALVLLALRRTNRDRLKPVLPRAWGIYLRDLWRMEWASLAILLTAVTASLDELHQSFLPSRTGVWQDVLLDTCGAIIAMYVMYVVSMRSIRHQQQRQAQAELSSAR